MKVVISTDNGAVSAHFGRCPQFTVLNLEDGAVTETKVIDNPGHSPGSLPALFKEMGAEKIIAGGMGMRAQQFFGQMGIEPIMGVSGSIADVTAALLDGSLEAGESTCSPGAGKGYGIAKEGEGEERH